MKPKSKYDFQKYETRSSFVDSIYTLKLVEAKEDQGNLLNNIIGFHGKFKQRSKEGKDKKEILMKNTCTLYERRELTINAFKSRIFTLKSTQGKGLKILTLKQMFP